MIYLLLLLSLAAPPRLSTVVTARQPDGTWKCSAFCLTSGNDDAGYCRLPVTARKQPSEDACKDELAAQCSKKKPPPGGCRWGSPPADSR